jgi:DNA-binding PadR family transcriptional regulator
MKPHLFQVLLALADRDRHGLEIMRDVLERTEGQTHLWPGMLYGSLKELVEAELVVEKRAPRDGTAGGGKPRYYGITAACSPRSFTESTGPRWRKRSGNRSR